MNTKKQNSIYLSRRNKILIPQSMKSSLSGRDIHSTVSDAQVATFVANISSLGYILSPKAMKAFKKLTLVDFKKITSDVISDLKTMKGSYVKYYPMYPNFPEQVMEASDIELFLNAIIHYVSNGKILPLYKKNKAAILSENVKYSVIDLGNENDFQEIFTNLMSSGTSLSENDKSDLEWFFKNYHFESVLPEQIPLKENVALVSKWILKYGDKSKCIELASKYIKSTTDVLRFAVALSGGDVSLATPTKFISFSRFERKFILSMLNNVVNLEEMSKYPEKWKRLGEKLHPGEYQQYKKAFLAFTGLREGKLPQSFNGMLNELFSQKSFDAAIQMLKARPGEFARRLDYMLRNTTHGGADFIVQQFKSVAGKVSVPVLLQLMAHFENRADKNSKNSESPRVFFPKGKIAKAFSVDDKRDPIKKETSLAVAAVCRHALVKIFANSGRELGNVYLSKDMKNYLVPFSQRSASKALKTIVRGSRIPIDKEKNIIRSFIYWKNGEDRTDLDLSAILYDEKWTPLQHIYYGALRNNHQDSYAVHSGDIVNAENGACEFIDLNLDSIKKNNKNVAYISFSVNSYTQQPLKDLPICFAGFMERERIVGKGEIFEPKTVKNKADLSSDTQISIPFLVDIHNNTVIWTDMSLRENTSYVNNVIGNKKGLAIIGEALVKMKKATLYDLFSLYVKACGKMVHSKDKADLVIDLEGDITPFDFDKIASFLSVSAEAEQKKQIQLEHSPH